MALKEIVVGGQTIWVEVADLPEDRSGRSEFTAVPEIEADLAQRIEKLVAALTTPVQAAFKGSGAAEWSFEINVGFKGETGVPFVAKGEANAAVKVSAKWTRPPAAPAVQLETR
ncbi:MAG: hypothetical protein KF778_04705 [Rhodocyclaceae bacterium]|nr:hypothetical protein [Rhodocyclaceae bacterium]